MDKFDIQKQQYIIPFLFPHKKPYQIQVEDGVNIEEINRNYEWVINYEFNFKVTFFF